MSLYNTRVVYELVDSQQRTVNTRVFYNERYRFGQVRQQLVQEQQKANFCAQSESSRA